MRPTLIGLFILPLAFVGLGCGRSEDKTKAAIERVLRADQALAKQRETLPPNATPSQIAWAIGVYCDGLDQIDMTDCPADFRVAYKQHLRAWRDLEPAVRQLPNGFLAGVFWGAFNSLLRGESDGGTNRIEGDLKHASERIRMTWEEIEKIGAKYGAAL